MTEIARYHPELNLKPRRISKSAPDQALTHELVRVKPRNDTHTNDFETWSVSCRCGDSDIPLMGPIYYQFEFRSEIITPRLPRSAEDINIKCRFLF